MNPGTDDPKDLGSKKINNHEKGSDKNEGFSGDNLPKNYDPSSKKLTPEIEKDEAGNSQTQKRARDVDEKQQPPVSDSDKTESNGKHVDKSRGTSNQKEEIETAENRDFNSDLDEKRYQKGDGDIKTSRGNMNFGESETTNEEKR
ncbi:MAG: hypothetical protein ACO1N9_11440 [Flavobacterium sp.]